MARERVVVVGGRLTAARAVVDPAALADADVPLASIGGGA